MKNLKATILGSTALGMFLASCGGGGGGGGGTGLTAPSSLAYEDARAIYMVGVDADPNLATVTGQVTQFSVLPALPTGLALDPLTGRIAGTPAARVAPGDYTITASNAAGSTQSTVAIEVVLPPRFLYAANAHDSTLSSFTVDPVAGGLEHNTFEASAIGEFSPEAICVHPSGRFLFVPNLATNNVSVYAVDENNGWLQTGTASLAGTGPHEIVVHPEGTFAYVASRGSNEVHVFSIDDTTGTLTQIGTPLVTSPEPSSLAIDPTGRFLLVGNVDFPRHIAVYDVDDATGTLSSSQPPLVLNGGEPVSLDFRPGGGFAFVVLANYDAVLSVSVDPADGRLRIVKPGGTQAGPTTVRAHPSGDMVFVTNQGDQSVSAFRVDRLTGSLTALGAEAVDTLPDDALFDPSGRFLYVLGSAARDILVFEVDDATGGLTALGGIRSRQAPSALAFVQGAGPVVKAPRFAYVANSASDDVSTFAIDALGANLTEVGLPALAGDNPVAVTVDPLVRFAYVANHDDGTIGAFAIDQDNGMLFEIAPAVAVGNGPTALSVDRSGRFLYSVQTDDDRMGVFLIDPNDGSLLQIASLALPDGLKRPEHLGTDPTGQFLYIAAAGDGTPGTSGVAVLAIDPRSGVPVRSSDPSLVLGASRVAFHPSGRAVFTTLDDSHEIASFRIDALDGGLAETLPRVSSVDSPSALSVDPSGRFLFAAFSVAGGLGQVTSYEIAANDSLGTPSGPFFAGTQPTDLAFDPSGRHLNVINRDSNEVMTFQFDAATGALALPSSTLTGLAPLAIAVTAVLQ